MLNLACRTLAASLQCGDSRSYLATGRATKSLTVGSCFVSRSAMGKQTCETVHIVRQCTHSHSYCWCVITRVMGRKKGAFASVVCTRRSCTELAREVVSHSQQRSRPFIHSLTVQSVTADRSWTSSSQQGAKSEVAGKRFDSAVVVRLTSVESVPGSGGLRNNLETVYSTTASTARKRRHASCVKRD